MSDAKTDYLFMPEDHMDELYNSGNPLVRFVHRQRLRVIANLLPATDGLRVLDAGCGEGHLTQQMQRRRPGGAYFGADATTVALDKARARCPFGTFHLVELSALDFADEFFDVIVATEVLEHVIHYEAVIGELKRVLKPGGLLIVTFPNEVLWTISRFVLRRRPVKIVDHVNSFSPQWMARLVGLPVVRQINLPFRLPFSISLGALMCFRK